MNNVLDETNNSEFDEENNFPDKLPPMLNVLTILTFIGSGFTLLTNIYSFLTLSTTKAQMEIAMSKMEEDGGTGNEFGDSIMNEALKSLEHGPSLYSTAIAVAILCIFGAFLMRQFKKSGYYIYVVACIIGIAIPLYILGAGLMAGMVLIGGVFSVLFIILYGVNLKHLK